MHLQSNTLIVEGCVILILKAPGRSHNLFMLEAVGEKAASYVMSALINTHMHTHKHSQAFLFLFLTYIPRNCTSFHLPCIVGAFKSQSDTFKDLSPTLTVLLFSNHVCKI